TPRSSVIRLARSSAYFARTASGSNTVPVTPLRYQCTTESREGHGARIRYGARVAAPVLAVIDDDGEQVDLDDAEVAALLAATGGLDAATVSACPGCRSRVVAAVALVDLLAEAPPVTSGTALVELADDAPTLHLYVRDLTTSCRHPDWVDTGAEEWADAMDDLVERRLPRP